MATQPIRDPNRGFRLWHIDEIYTGPDDEGVYVPNVGDAVLSWEKGLFKVTYVNSTTHLSTLKSWKEISYDNSIDDTDVLLGVKAGNGNECYRCYIDTSVVPYSMVIDSRLKIYGSTADHVKVFKGNYLAGDDAEVISAVYSPSGDYMGDKIQLEKVFTPDGENHAIYTPRTAFTNVKMEDGELVTAVTYDEVGGVCGVTKLLVKNTAFIRDVTKPKKIVKDIFLESAFLDPVDVRGLQIPINTPVDSIPLNGRVEYTDGTSRKVAIDGVRMSLIGLNSYLASIVGQKNDLVLSYHMTKDEQTFDMVNSFTNHMSRRYKVTTLNRNGAYTVKLYVSPEWSVPNARYELRFWLYTLDRTEGFEVTEHVRVPSGTPQFDPGLYGTKQDLVFNIRLSDVDDRWNDSLHFQNVGITLISEPHSIGDCWHVHYSESIDHPPFGQESAIQYIANAPDDVDLDISCGASSLGEWIEKLYDRSQPLYDPDIELGRLEPTHFILNADSTRIRYPITDWNKSFNITTAPTDGTLIHIEWVKETANDDLMLGISPLFTRRIYT